MEQKQHGEHGTKNGWTDKV